MNGLDLYAKIEYLFDFDEVIDYLWDKYIDELKSLNVKTILDIGCGSGGFMQKAKKAGFEIVGIDVSKEMINNAKQKNLDVYHKDLCDCHQKFDACVAIFDVINYMDKDYLKKFFKCVKNVLKDDGYFLFDINTLYGFEEIAQGTLYVGDEKISGILNSIFNDNVMKTDIIVFERQGDCWNRYNGEIVQYFYDNKYLDKIAPLDFYKNIEINLYGGDLADKNLLVFKKVC